MRVRGSRLIGFVAAAGAVLFLSGGAVAGDGSGDAPEAVFGANLLRNGGAEANVGGDGYADIPPIGWSRTGRTTVVKYGAAGGFPRLADPGPPVRGRNFLSGGQNAPLSEIDQTVSLAWAAATIDAGKARYTLSGYLGGYLSQTDHAKVEVKFMNAARRVIAKRQIGPVTSTARANTTGLYRRTATGVVPKGARWAKVEVTSTRFSGSYNDGYADNISLVLRKF